ncbi:hypothetical protein PCASD_13053 [Puccinia coronata f. sp. avenae]|uniref:Major facilitator superfamily (MFS) profile domain-containing protein n=1 Tax=Puccinia coronata f. sp. avenae TaxID=200324 RepID=A0A2N5U4H0_9BASI|nr:hypothetical protein PCASD_13053 [Puccinia coronata f. sp. avenae]
MEPEACKTRNSSGQESGEKSTECSEPSPDQQETIDPRAEKEAVRRADWIILPITFLYSFLSHLDRSNLGNARVAGLQEGLAITDYQFSIALTTTFVLVSRTPLLSASPPCHIFVTEKIGANIMIPLLVTIWGLVTTFQGFVYNYEGLLAARFFLGAVEGGLYPATVLFGLKFIQKGPYRSVCLLVDTARWCLHIPGWGWIFIIEGIFTTICGILGFFIFPRSLATCKFLTPVQRRIMTIRMEQDRPVGARSIEEKFTWYQVYCALKSPHVLLAIGSLFMVGSNLYGLAYFEPSIVKTFGHSARMTQLVSVPPFAVGFFAMLSSAYFSDRYEARGITAVAMGAIAFAGYLMFMISTSNHYRYISLFLSTAGIYSASPTMYAWIANNSAPHYRKAAAIALGPIFANTGGILSTWLFPSSEEPRYQTATIVNLCL